MVSRIRVATYNVLSPSLCTPSYFSFCHGSDVEPKKRLKKVLRKLDEEVRKDSVICLQEVSYWWAGEFHCYFAKKKYTYIHSPYGWRGNGYMGVGIAFPQNKYELLETHISRIADTKGTGYEDPNKREKRFVARAEPSVFSLIYRSLSQLFGKLWQRALPNLSVGTKGSEAPASPPNPWKSIERRTNTMVFLKLKEISSEGETKPFGVATYHMPCAFREPPVMGVHTSLVARQANKLAGNEVFILAGDFNFIPGSPCYELITKGKGMDAEQKQSITPAMPAFEGDTWCLGVEVPLKSAIKEANGEEPNFTNLAKTEGQDEQFCETLDYIFYRGGKYLFPIKTAPLPHRDEFRGTLSFPSEEEPSDHIKIAAEFDLFTTKQTSTTETVET